VVGNLMPTESIRPNEISVTMREENYFNSLSVFTSLDDGEYIDGTIEKVSVTDDGTAVSLGTVTSDDAKELNPDVYVTTALNADNQYSRCTFVVKAGGVYRITLNKRDENGNILQTSYVYKSFSYSQEYDTKSDQATENELTNDQLTEEETEPNSLLSTLATRGNGSYVTEEDPWEVFSTLDPNIDKTFDPRLLFIILAMVMFLLDIAVRKFKFKWLHEIIRERNRNNIKN
jgi:hypothetical protein